MSADPRSLEARLGKVRGRSKYVPHDAAVAMGAFVCPRADGYGAREGVIPPGVAAQEGLIPKGLREVSTDAALHSARQNDENPMTAQEQYRAYYGKGAQQQETRTPQRPLVVLPPEPEPEPEAVEDVPEAEVPAAPQEEAPPAPPPAPPPVPKAVKTASRKPVPKTPARKVPWPDAKASKTSKASRAVRTAVPQAPRVFSQANSESEDPETLEGFYAGLDRERHFEGVAEQDWPETPESRGEKRTDTVPPRTGDVPAVPTRRAHGIPQVPSVQDRMITELKETFEAELAEQRQLAKDWYEEAERRRLDLERHQMLLSHQNTELQRLTQAASEARTSHDDGPVRVYLGMEDVKLKVAGRGWDCNVLGHLCYSRGKTEVALVVTDPGYGSDLLANVQEGECVLVSSAGRTACQYRGHCDKIYGETDSPDFITVMRFACDPNKAFA